MSRKIAFFIVKLPLQDAYNTYENSREASARKAYVDAYNNAYAEVQAAVKALNLPEGTRPSLFMDEFLEPYVYLINIKPEAAALLLASNKLGTFDIAPVPA